MIEALLESQYTMGILIGVLFGFCARINMLRTDYRQYPTYPHGRIIHLSMGLIAAALGAVFVPALFSKDYTAITFLTLAAQQFRDVRNMERETLTQMDHLELVPRGTTYIEGIAMVFEGRNYLVIFTAFIASLMTVLFAWYWGVLAGIAAIMVDQVLKSGKQIRHVADVQHAEVRFEGPNLYVGDIYMMNVGLQANRETIRKYGMGFILVPKNQDCRVTIANLGQRQAILHDMSTILGVVRDSGEPALTPMAKLDLHDGRLGIFVIAQVKDQDKAHRALMNTPLLESAVKRPSAIAKYEK